MELDQLCMHTCSILGREGPNWPAPTFRIVAADRPEEVLDAKSPTGAWNAVLSRINSEIEARCACLNFLLFAKSIITFLPSHWISGVSLHNTLSV